MTYEEIPKNVHDIIENQIYYLCYSRQSRKTLPGYDQDDLAQELRLHIYRKLETHLLNSYKNPQGWIVTCMKRRLIDMYRSTQRSNDAFIKCDVCGLEERDQEIN